MLYFTVMCTNSQNKGRHWYVEDFYITDPLYRIHKQWGLVYKTREEAEAAVAIKIERFKAIFIGHSKTKKIGRPCKKKLY